MRSLTPKLTGAGARSAQGTNTGHENGEAMASVGVRVERPVRRFSVHEIFSQTIERPFARRSILPTQLVFLQTE
jgi:hypothetical protein